MSSDFPGCGALWAVCMCVWGELSASVRGELLAGGPCACHASTQRDCSVCVSYVRVHVLVCVQQLEIGVTTGLCHGNGPTVRSKPAPGETMGSEIWLRELLASVCAHTCWRQPGRVTMQAQLLDRLGRLSP